jgi:hypothetical protein
MFTWADGSTYDGEFYENNIDGKGNTSLFYSNPYRSVPLG